MTRQPGLSFRLFGHPITIGLWFLLVAGALGATSPFDVTALGIWLAVATISILWHEFGHALAFRAYGFDSSIELWALGGVTRPAESYDPAERPGRDILISLAGPTAGLLLGIAAHIALIGIAPSTPPYVRYALEELRWINLGWSLVNLVPMLPLDGGRVMMRVLETTFRGREGAAAYCISGVVALAVAAWGFFEEITAITLAGAFLGLVFLSMFGKLQGARHGPDGQPVWLSDTLAAVARGDRKRVLRIAKPRLRVDGTNQTNAAFLVTAAFALDGRYGEARAIAERYLEDAVVSPELTERFVLAVGGEEKAIRLWHRAFEVEPAPVIGGLLLDALVEAGRLDEAKRLLPDPRLAFDSLRDRPQFARIREKVGA
ncbi:MAG TPA: site-2 protease family protein [Actinomycetota bacterium]